MSEVIRIQQRDVENTKQLFFCTGMFNLTFASLFYLFSSMDGLYGDENECLILRRRAQDYTIILFALAILTFLVVMIVKNQQQINKCFESITFFSAMICFVFYLLLILALKKGEPCEGLTLFTFVYLIFITLMFACVLCILCLALAVAQSDQQGQ